MNRRAAYTTLLFDFDGTIADTNELILETFRHVAQTELGRELAPAQIIPHMGKTLRDQWRILSGREAVDDLISAYRRYNLQVHDRLTRPFPHVRETLHELRKRPVKLGLVTSKVRLTTEKGLKLLGLGGFFEAVVTADDVVNPKPDPEPVATAIRLLAADPERTLMVGDSPADLLSAKQAGARSAAVAWSLKGLDVLRDFHPDEILQDMRDVLALAGE